jgi:hypothetical protein
MPGAAIIVASFCLQTAGITISNFLKESLLSKSDEWN